MSGSSARLAWRTKRAARLVAQTGPTERDREIARLVLELGSVRAAAQLLDVSHVRVYQILGLTTSN